MKNENRNQHKSVKAVPDGYHTITPFIIADNAAGFMDFTTKAFGGKITFVMNTDDNKVMHATIKIGDSIIMVTDTMEGMGPQTAMLFLYVADVDAVYKKAIEASGVSVREPLNEFYGDRAACVKDAWGNQWWIATHVENVSEAELRKRKEQMTHQPA